MIQEQSHELAALRGEVDQIDERTLNLIEHRLTRSLNIATAIRAQGERLLKLRPRRQAEILASSAKVLARQLVRPIDVKQVLSTPRERISR